MALEKLIAGIRAEAEAEASDIIETAREEAATIIADARRQAENEAAILQAKRLAASRQEANQRVSQPQLIAQKKTLNARQTQLQQVLSDCRQRLRSLSGDKLQHWLSEQIVASSMEGNEQLSAPRYSREWLDDEWVTQVNRHLKAHGKKGALQLHFRNQPDDHEFVLQHQHFEIIISMENTIAGIMADQPAKIAAMLFTEHEYEMDKT